MAGKVIIIGGVAAGATAAARLRRRDESVEIILFERGEYISYANCGLPYYIGDVIKNREALLLQSPHGMKDNYHIDVRVSQEVIRIAPDEKKVEVRNLKTKEVYEEGYDQLVIATGSSPIRPSIPGIDADNIFTIWDVADMDTVKAYIKNENPCRAAVVGGGFIGLEMAENLHKSGLEVSLIEMQDQVMGALDYEMANLLHETLRMNYINLIFKDAVKSFETIDGSTRILLASGADLDVDLVILSIGVRANSYLAKDAGIETGAGGGIVVDEYLQTSARDIYAVGDVIEVKQPVTGEKTRIPLAGPANKQGRILADNLAGDKKQYNGTLGTAIAKVFDLNAASVGLNEKQLQAMGKVKKQDYDTVLINQRSHAGYYPGAVMLTMKMIFNKEGTIYGAQVVGLEGVDKRIDVIAAAMRLNGTIYDLEELELSYAPPFSSAKDPVNMLGFTAGNVLNGLVCFIEWNEVDAILQDTSKAEDYIILDVTEEKERMTFAISFSYHIPLGELRRRMDELDKNKTIIPYCAIGVRSYIAARMLMQNGFKNVKVLSGGTSFYRSMHHMEDTKALDKETIHDKVILK